MAARSNTRSTRGSLALALLVTATAATLSSAFLNPALASRRLLQHQAQRALPAAARQAGRATPAMMSAGGKEWALIFDCDGVILEVRRLVGWSVDRRIDWWTDWPCTCMYMLPHTHTLHPV